MTTAQQLFAVCAVACALAACDDASTAVTYDGADVQLLTPDVALQLDSRGRFPEQQVEAGYVNPRTRANADSLARRYIAENAALQREEWERMRGASIDVSRLTRCSPIRYSRSAYEITEIATDKRWRQLVGGQFHLLFCGPDGRPALLVQVPVEPAFPASGFSGDLANIWVSVVNIEAEATALIGPEEAVRLAAGRTGQRVASVPEYVNERFTFGFPRWIVRLESPIGILGLQTLETDTLDVVAVGYSNGESSGAFIPAALRPHGIATPEARLDTIIAMEGDPIDVYPVRVGVPRWFEHFLKLETP